MTPVEVVTLISFLDQLFSLGGKLIEAAVQKAPELITTPLPDLDAMDKARTEALERTKDK